VQKLNINNDFHQYAISVHMHVTLHTA